MLEPGRNYTETYQNFRWRIPGQYNIGVDVCDKWAGDKDRLALIYQGPEGLVSRYTFAQLKDLSNRLANGLAAHGINRGDRVGILLPQCPETALVHLAVYKLGGIAVPLFTLFGPDALSYRLFDSGAKAVVTNDENLPKILGLRDELTGLDLILNTGSDNPESVIGFSGLVEKGSPDFNPVLTGPDDPALIIYTSGTTGPPKGALHAHRVVLGHLPGVEFPHNFFPQKGDLFWTPADWAWIGGLIDALLPAWHHGVPVLAHRARKFDPEEAFSLMAAHKVRNAFMPPTALKIMRQVKNPSQRWDYELRSVGSGGETLGEGLLDWGREALGLTINEFYGQTEANLLIANCAQVMDIRPGSMGLPIPGREVAVLDKDGRVVGPGISGEVAVKSPDPVMFLEYWNNSQATAAKYKGDWLLTGDLAKRDEDGYFWFVGRTDDVITSSGYRIGPAEIEDCLLKHRSVAMAAVIGKPDQVRTEIVKAFIQLNPEIEPDPGLAGEIKDFVKTRLAAHEYPREIEFVDDLPLTATGKIIRGELRRRELDEFHKVE